MQSLVAYALLLASLVSVAGSLSCSQLSNTYLQLFPDPAPLHAPSPDNAKPTVYFLHIPRTAGRTLNMCLLSAATPPSQRCLKYEQLKARDGMQHCALLTSHDDYSAMQLLRPGTAVITQLRDPVDRFLSAYEFAVETAAHQEAPATASPSARNSSKRGNNNIGSTRAQTQNVWPWSLLVPFFASDIKRRAAAYTQPGATGELPPLDPYHNPLVMPLEEFVRHPIAKELLHNGQTFQVLGITNYSHWGDAGELRACMWGSERVRSHLLDVALARINKFVHVGSTGRLMDSVAAAAVSLHLPLDGAVYMGAEEGEELAYVNDTSTDASVQQARHVRQVRLDLQQLQQRLFQAAGEGKEGGGSSGGEEQAALQAKLEAAREQLRKAQADLRTLRSQASALTVSHSLQAEAGVPVTSWLDRAARNSDMTLAGHYTQCASRSRQSNSRGRNTAMSSLVLPDGRSIQFGRSARALIPAQVLGEIRSLNSLDVALHELGEQLLSARVSHPSTTNALRKLSALSKDAQAAQAPSQGNPLIKIAPGAKIASLQAASFIGEDL